MDGVLDGWTQENHTNRAFWGGFGCGTRKVMPIQPFRGLWLWKLINHTNPAFSGDLAKDPPKIVIPNRQKFSFGVIMPQKKVKTSIFVMPNCLRQADWYDFWAVGRIGDSE